MRKEITFQVPEKKMVTAISHWLASYAESNRLIRGTLWALSYLPIPYMKKTLTKALAEVHKRNHISEIDELSPPEEAHPQRPKSTTTFNHTHSFTITNGTKEDHIWAALRNENPPKWTLVYFPELKGKRILDMHADGANLCARDTEGVIHYKKVIKEKHEDDKYIAIDKTHTSRQKSAWFTLPVISSIMNLFYQRKLVVKANDDWRISHRGDFMRFYEDENGTQHGFKAHTKITHLYKHKKAKKRLRAYDPFMPLQVKIDFLLPDKTHRPFDLIAWDASASAVFLLGYESSYNDDDQVQKSLVAYFRILDLDSSGFNPAFSYSFNPKDKDKRLLPMKDYQKILLPLEAALASDVTLSQIGQGNNGYMFTLWGRLDKKGEPGKFTKKIDDKGWLFTETHPDHPLQYLETEFIDDKELYSSVTQWSGSDPEKTFSMRLYDYCPGKLLSDGVLSIDNESFNIHYYERKSIIYDTLGWHSHYADIVIYDKDDNYADTLRAEIEHHQAQDKDQKDFTKVTFWLNDEKVMLNLEAEAEKNELNHYKVPKLIMKN